MSFLSKMFNFQKAPITVAELEAALHNQELIFHYQPEWDLKTNRVVGVEALARWKSPKRGNVPPMQFIPLLEETGLIHQFTSFLFRKTLSDFAQLQKVQPDLFVAVNLSALQLQEENLVDVIQKSLADHQLSVRHLECELTETQELTEDILSNSQLKNLAELNIPVSIDDFGAGCWSFDHLKCLDVKKIKIDLSFIQRLMDDAKNQEIVSSMIQLGHDLGFPVLAEGIETMEQEIWLKEHGCDYGQGYWFSRPLPLDELMIFLQQKNR